jgi:cytochrome c peroxidase
MKLAMAVLVSVVAQSAASVGGAPVGLDVYMPVPERNPMTRERVEAGRRLFFDRRLSHDGTISCATCHEPERAFSDGRTVAIGVGRRVGRRNAPTLVNRGYGRLFFWDGRVDTLEEQVTRPIEDPAEMDLPLALAAARTGVTVAEMSDSLASYVRSIRSESSRVDRYLADEPTALDEQEQLGLQVFRTTGQCVTCHIGPNFTDEELHNTGVAWSPSGNSASIGRFRDPGAGHGEFKTPTLREVARTGPYMHDGSLPSLRAVIDFYDRGGRPNPYLDAAIQPRHFSVPEKAALEAFLRALSGNVVEGLGR